MKATNSALWETRKGKGPLLATAIHDGHEVRPPVYDLLEISESDRLREEDPYTGTWARLAETYVVAKRSRFEVDLNRPRAKAVYIAPEDSWGLKVWKETPGADLIEHSLRQYDAFYRHMDILFAELAKRWRHFVVLDIHTYNHRRAGQDEAPADPEANPEVNIGTGTMNRRKWSPVVDRFIADLRSFPLLGRQMDVRENVKFKGGHFAAWTHERFPKSGCVIAIEFKKTFMDEWTGNADPEHVHSIGQAIQSTFPGLLEELAQP
jgi:hypothetical protein